MEDFIKNKTYFDCCGGDKEEFIILSLRLKSGLNFKEYKARYDEDFQNKIKSSNILIWVIWCGNTAYSS